MDLNPHGFNRLCAPSAQPARTPKRQGRQYLVLRRGGGAGGTVIYAAAKISPHGLHAALALEWAVQRAGERCRSRQLPGPGLRPGRATRPLENAAQNTPAGRAGEVREIGYAVCYLASSEADYVTGQTLSVDGGVSLL